MSLRYRVHVEVVSRCDGCDGLVQEPRSKNSKEEKMRSAKATGEVAEGHAREMADLYSDCPPGCYVVDGHVFCPRCAIPARVAYAAGSSKKAP